MKNLLKNVPYNILLAISANIGLAQVTFPVLFQKYGLVLTFISLVFLAGVTNNASDIYISKMKSSKQQWELEDVVEFHMGKRWRRAFLVIKIIKLTQINLIYLLSIISFMRSAISTYPTDDILTGVGIFLLLTIISVKSEGLWLVKFSWASCVSLAACFVIIVGITIYSGINQDDFSNILNNISISSVPDLLSNNNLWFHFQLYLPKILNSNDSMATNKRVSRWTILISLFYLSIIGIIGALYIQDYGIAANATVIVDFFNSYPCSIALKLILIYHLAANISFKLPFIRTSMIELLTDKVSREKREEIAEDLKSRLGTALGLVVFFFLMVFSTQSQQGYFTTITGSISSFFLFYRIPYGLKYPSKKRKAKYMQLKELKKSEANVCSNNQNSNDQENLAQVPQKKKKKKDSKISLCPTLEKSKDVILLMIGYAIFIYGFVSFVVQNIKTADEDSSQLP